MEWTPEQRRIIDYGKGDLLVSASAGSGKTTVMLGRVMRLIEEGVSLRNMLISTFTVSAADDMRGKLARKLREKIAELSALKGGEDDGAATEKRCRDALDYRQTRTYAPCTSIVRNSSENISTSRGTTPHSR